MTRKPGAPQDVELPLGGKAAERLRMFYEARGISKDPGAERVYTSYPPSVLAAITAAESAAQGQGQASPPPQWYFLGPDLIPNGQASLGTVRVSVSGRVSAIAVDPQNGNHLLCGSGAGGIWESFSRGADWAPRTDFMPTLTTGAIAFDPGNAKNNTNIVYAGTGEGNKFWFMGQGMLKSADGGTTWAVLQGTAAQTDGTLVPGTPFTGTGFYQIIVDPANSQHILAAVNGLPKTGGLYETKDGGTTWTRVIAANDCFDISMQPGGGTAAEVLAATDAGLRKSTNGGTKWDPETPPGAPASWTRLAVSISPADPTVAFAFGASQDKAYLWRRSSSGGWSAITPPSDLTATQAGYDWYVAAAPDNAGQVYLGAIDVYRGDLGKDGTTWTWSNLSNKTPGDCIHADQHAIAFDPASAGTVYCAGDGGVYRSPDRGVSWVSLNPGLGITEIEYMVNANANSRWLLAGTQDNGTIRYLGTSAFEHVDDGDGGDCGVDQTNPATCYDTFIYMAMYRSTQGGASGTFKNITPPIPKPRPAGYSLFYPPVGVAGSTISIAGQSVWISRDTGTTWAEVKLPAPEVATALYLPSPDLVYAATKTGRFFTIPYAGGAWTIITAQTLPRQAYVSAIRTDQSTPPRIWVTTTQVGSPQAGLVWCSGNGGTTWTDKTGNLPAIPVSSIAFDPANASRAWVSADVGVYQSADGGSTWTPFFQNLPYVIVEDLEFHPDARVLRAGTRSRGVWEVAVDKPGSSAPPQGLKACAIALNSNGWPLIFGVGTDKAVRYSQPGFPDWSGFMQIGSGFAATSAPAAATNSDGRTEVFARGPDGALWHAYQTATGVLPDWSAWESLGGILTASAVAARNQDGRLEVFARGPDGALWHTWQNAANNKTADGWSAWASLGGVITTMPAAALNADGRLEVFARGPDGTLRHSYQTSQASSSSWSPWEPLGGVLAGNPAAAGNQDGRLEVFARGPDGALWHTWQNAASNKSADGWSAWEKLGGNAAMAGDPAAAANSDGRLEVFARGPDGALWHTWQNAANNKTADGWSAWQSLGGALTSDPAAAFTPAIGPSGSLQVSVRGTDYMLYRIFQTPATNSGWSGWWSMQSFGQPFQAFP